jgi:hypothetical protein
MLFEYSPFQAYESSKRAFILAKRLFQGFVRQMIRKPEILDWNALSELAGAKPALDQFGYQGEYPYIAVDLAGSDGSLSGWLKDRPCPVIGIGEGRLADACDVVLVDTSPLGQITFNIEKSPLAAMILVQHLRASEHLSVRDALTAESFAYATVQKGSEFLTWLDSASPQVQTPRRVDEPLILRLEGNRLRLTLNDTENGNAIGVQMRDALCEGLDLALADPVISKVNISAIGRTFSTGGNVNEFGEVTDPATAHWVRSLRLPAWRLARLRERLHIHVNGAAIGAGAEIAAFASRVSASEKSWFQLPELKYGLIPGAGGTASLPRRIGRQRTAFMALSMKRIKAVTALEWGLVDEIL